MKYSCEERTRRAESLGCRGAAAAAAAMRAWMAVTMVGGVALLLVSCGDPSVDVTQSSVFESPLCEATFSSIEKTYVGTNDVTFGAAIECLSVDAPIEVYVLVVAPDQSMVYLGGGSSPQTLSVSPLTSVFEDTFAELLPLDEDSPEGIYSTYLILSEAGSSPVQLVQTRFHFSYSGGVGIAFPPRITDARIPQVLEIFVSASDDMIATGHEGRVFVVLGLPDSSTKYLTRADEQTVTWSDAKTAYVDFNAGLVGSYHDAVLGSVFDPSFPEGRYSLDLRLETTDGTEIFVDGLTFSYAPNEVDVELPLSGLPGVAPGETIQVRIIDLWTLQVMRVWEEPIDDQPLHLDLKQGDYLAVFSALRDHRYEHIHQQSFSVDASALELDLELNERRSASTGAGSLGAISYGPWDFVSVSVEAFTKDGVDPSGFDRSVEREEVRNDGDVRVKISELGSIVDEQLDMIKNCGKSAQDFGSGLMSRYQLQVTSSGGSLLADKLSLRGEMVNLETCEVLFHTEVSDIPWDSVATELYAGLTLGGYTSLTDRITKNLESKNPPSFYTYGNYHPASPTPDNCKHELSQSRYAPGDTVTVTVSYKEPNGVPIAGFNPTIRIVEAPPWTVLQSETGGNGQEIEIEIGTDGEAEFRVQIDESIEEATEIKLQVIKKSKCRDRNLLDKEIIILGAQKWRAQLEISTDLGCSSEAPLFGYSISGNMTVEFTFEVNDPDGFARTSGTGAQQFTVESTSGCICIQNLVAPSSVYFDDIFVSMIDSMVKFSIETTGDMISFDTYLEGTCQGNCAIAIWVHELFQDTIFVEIPALEEGTFTGFGNYSSGICDALDYLDPFTLTLEKVE